MMSTMSTLWHSDHRVTAHRAKPVPGDENWRLRDCETSDRSPYGGRRAERETGLRVANRR